MIFLSSLIIVINIERFLFVTYCYIISESTTTFHFMYNCIIDWFFSIIILNLLFYWMILTNLILFIIKKKKCRIDIFAKFDEINVRIVDKTFDIVFKLQIQLFERNIECKFQFCTWHIDKTIMKKLTQREKYSIKTRE